MLAFLAAASVGLLAVALVGATERRTLAFTLGVRPTEARVLMLPGQTACQGPILASTAFDAVELLPGTYHRPGPALDVSVTRAGAVVGRGRVGAGYADDARQDVRVGMIRPRGELTVCVRDAGDRVVALWGGDDAMAAHSTATVDGRPQHADVMLVFRRPARSTLAMTPDILARAALFRSGWIGAWLYWTLLVGTVVAVPALLAVAFGAAGGER